MKNLYEPSLHVHAPYSLNKHQTIARVFTATQALAQEKEPLMCINASIRRSFDTYRLEFVIKYSLCIYYRYCNFLIRWFVTAFIKIQLGQKIW